MLVYFTQIGVREASGDGDALWQIHECVATAPIVPRVFYGYADDFVANFKRWKERSS